MCKRRNKFNPNAEIAKLLIRAQNGSNGGKGISAYTTDSQCVADNARGYNLKVSCIKEAIKLINEHADCKFEYHVVKDIRHIAKYVVYFETYLEGKKVQTSFHSYEDLSAYCEERHARNRRYRACDSVLMMYRYYVPTGAYA